MLSKQEYAKLEQLLAECNATYEETDPKIMRKGATGQAHSQFLRTASTKELILHDVSIIAKQFLKDRFHVEFDGISGFVIFRNNHEVLKSNYYQVEHCYQVGYQQFLAEIAKAVNEQKTSAE